MPEEIPGEIVTHCFVQEVEHEQAVVLDTERSWIAVHVYLPSDLREIQGKEPSVLDTIEDLGPEDNIVIVSYQGLPPENVKHLLANAAEMVEVPE